MTPFLRFRTWLRRGPNGERVPVAIATVAILVLLVWIAVPVDDHDETLSAGAGTPSSLSQPGTGFENGSVPSPRGSDAEADGSSPVSVSGEATSAGERQGRGTPPGSSAPPGAAGDQETGASPDAPSDAGAAGGQDPCAGLRATDQGVTAEEIFVAVPVINLAGQAGNETFGVRGNVEEVADAAAAGINGEGGVACRKLRIKVYRVNPLDQNEQRATCLEIAEAKPFAVIDYGGYINPAARSCFVRAKLPYQGNSPSNEDEVSAAHPFMYSVLPTTDDSLRDWVFAAATRGAFDPEKGFRKIGLLLDECNPKANAELKQNLTKVGVPGDKIASFTMAGCLAIGSPNEVAQAVVRHRNAGVSHVFFGTNASNSQNYVRQADGIGWKPTYMVSDYGSVTNPTQAPNWPDGFDGTVGISSQRVGERSSGIEHPLVADCNEWMKRSGVRPSEEESDGTPLLVCDQFRLFAAAANAAGPELTRATLLDGLVRVGKFEGARFGVGVYDRPGKVTGGDFVRAVQWHRDCRCWKVIDRDMAPTPRQ